MGGRCIGEECRNAGGMLDICENIVDPRMTHPPKMAIFIFFLNVGVSSHAGRPPGMAADRQMTKSLSVDVATM